MIRPVLNESCHWWIKYSHININHVKLFCNSEILFSKKNKMEVNSDYLKCAWKKKKVFAQSKVKQSFCFFSSYFMILVFTVWSVIHVKIFFLIHGKEVWIEIHIFFPLVYGYPVIPEPFLENMILYSLNCICTLFNN